MFFDGSSCLCFVFSTFFFFCFLQLLFGRRFVELNIFVWFAFLCDSDCIPSNKLNEERTEECGWAASKQCLCVSKISVYVYD